MVRTQLYKVLLAGWYSPVLSYKKNKYRDFSSLTLKKTFLKQKPTPILGARSYSTITYENSLDNTEFYEWLCGFVDGEGMFRIKKDSRRDKFPYSWEFTIYLHIDDKHALDYIQKRLNIGYVKYYDGFSKFSVYSKTEIKEIINIFSKYPLNTSKRLNFEDWKKAFELYYADGIINGNREKIIPVVEKLREGMNKGRYYETYNVDNVRITKYWLLGFIEGEGSFYFQTEGFAVAFALGQVSRDKPLWPERKNCWVFKILCWKFIY